MRDWIIRLDRWLEAERPELYASLLPGATAEELGQLEQTLRLRMPPSFHELYRWRNGQAGDCFVSFFYVYELMSIEWILAEWETLREVSSDFPPDWWRSGWVSFLAGGTGDFFCIDMEGSFEGVPGQTIWYWHDDSERRIEYPSLDSWGSLYVHSLEANLWEIRGGSFRPKRLQAPSGAVTASIQGTEDAFDRFLRAANPGYPRIYRPSDTPFLPE